MQDDANPNYPSIQDVIRYNNEGVDEWWQQCISCLVAEEGEGVFQEAASDWCSDESIHLSMIARRFHDVLALARSLIADEHGVRTRVAGATTTRPLGSSPETHHMADNQTSNSSGSRVPSAQQRQESSEDKLNIVPQKITHLEHQLENELCFFIYGSAFSIRPPENEGSYAFSDDAIGLISATVIYNLALAIHLRAVTIMKSAPATTAMAYKVKGIRLYEASRKLLEEERASNFRLRREEFLPLHVAGLNNMSQLLIDLEQYEEAVHASHCMIHSLFGQGHWESEGGDFENETDLSQTTPFTQEEIESFCLNAACLSMQILAAARAA